MDDNLQIWVVDSLEKIFPNTIPPYNKELTPEPNWIRPPVEDRLVPRTGNDILLFCGARNEVESGQIAVRSENNISTLKIETGPLRHVSRCGVIGQENVRTFFQGLVSIDGYYYPDPLLEDKELKIEASVTRAIWVNVYIPSNTAPGRYKGNIRIIADKKVREIDIELEVWPFILPDKPSFRLNLWFKPQYLCEYYQVKKWSQEYWNLVQKYAKDLAVHGQKVITAPFCGPHSLVDWYLEQNGGYGFDFTRLDRHVELFMNQGINELIEFFTMYPPHSPEKVSLELINRRTGENKKEIISVGSAKYDQIWTTFIRALSKHLEERGWLDKAMIKISDEPTKEEIDCWRKAAKLVKKASPRLKVTDAFARTKPYEQFIDCVDVWAVHLWNFDHDFAARCQSKGAEVWWYTCNDCNNPNTFIKSSLIEARLIPWLMWENKVDGFLRWSYIDWSKTPWCDTKGYSSSPQGDKFLVYPGAEGPASSIRWEAMREGMEDYEYLTILDQLMKEKPYISKESRTKLDRAIHRVVMGEKYTRDPFTLRSVRAYIAKAIVELSSVPC
ncbi:MAG TPA: DUF4091 domain-containing protein [bacterium (Candidatus Stahlbacteria)]|nr:DUF4091 domain-containing protein [Candidatus Stahlbacteria bacterium]